MKSENHADGQPARLAGEFLADMAAELKAWLGKNAAEGRDAGNQWELTAVLADGTRICVSRLSAHGCSCIAIEGELAGGGLGMLISHFHSVQFLASYSPDSAKAKQKREIGFHTGMGKEIKISQQENRKS